jgi:hypothetical protein
MDAEERVAISEIKKLLREILQAVKDLKPNRTMTFIGGTPRQDTNLYPNKITCAGCGFPIEPGKDHYCLKESKPVEDAMSHI